MGVWQCEREDTKTFDIRMRYRPSTPPWVKNLGGLLLACLITVGIPVFVICKLSVHFSGWLADSSIAKFFVFCWVIPLLVFGAACCFYYIKDARNYSRVADLLIATPQRLIVVLDIYLNRSAKTYCAGSVQEVEKGRIKLKGRYNVFYFGSLYLAEPECRFINTRRQKIKSERFPIMENKQFRELINKYSESEK
jgi:hypothetical protein